MGLFSKKTKSTETSHGTFNTTQTPSNPGWVDSGLAGLGGRISDLSNLDPYSLVAGPDPLQLKAADTANSLTGSPWNFDAAADITRGVAGADSPSVQGVGADGYISKYMNPYTDSVVNSSLAGFDQNANQTRQQQSLDLAGDSTFGGSGGSILRGLTEGQLGLSRGQLEGGLRSQGFDTALGAAQQDANREQAARTSSAGLMGDTLNRRLAAGGQLADISSAYDTNQRANAGAQLDIGSVLQQLRQNRATAPLSLLGAQTSMFSGLPLGLTHGQNTTGVQDTTSISKSSVSDPLGTMGGLALGAGSLASGLGAMGLGFGGGFGGLFNGVGLGSSTKNALSSGIY